MVKLCLWCVAVLVTLGRAQELTTMTQPVSFGEGVLPEEILPKLYEKYREAVEDVEREVSRRCLFNHDREYEIHVQKLKDVNGYKLHNLRIREKNKLGDTFVYVNNPIESKLPNAYLTLDEFKQSLVNTATKNRQLRSTQEKHTIFKYVTTKQQHNAVIWKTLKAITTKATEHTKEFVKHVNEYNPKPAIKPNNTKITNKTTKEKTLKLNYTQITNRTIKDCSLKHTLKSSKKSATRILKQHKKVTNSSKKKLRKIKKRHKTKKKGKAKSAVFRANDNSNSSNIILVSSDAVITKQINEENATQKIYLQSMAVISTEADAKYNLAKSATKEVSIDTFLNTNKHSSVIENYNYNDTEDTPRSLIDDRMGRNGNTNANIEELSPVTQENTLNTTTKSASNGEVATNKTNIKREKPISGETKNLSETAGDKKTTTSVSNETTAASDIAEEITDETTISLDTDSETPDVAEEITDETTIVPDISDETTSYLDADSETPDVAEEIISDVTEETTIFLDTSKTPDIVEENTASSAITDEIPDGTTSLSDIPDEKSVSYDNTDENIISSNFPDAIAADSITLDDTTTVLDVTATFDDITATSDDIAVTSDDTTVASDDATAASDDKTVASDDATAKPDDATATSDDATTASDEVTAVSDDTTSASDDMTDVSDDATTASDDATAVLNDANTALNDLNDASDDATTASDDATAASDDITAASDDITATSDDTTAGSDDTTVVSDDAEVVSEDTTVMSEDPPAKETPVERTKEEQPTELTTVKSTRRTLGRPAVFMGGMWD